MKKKLFLLFSSLALLIATPVLAQSDSKEGIISVLAFTTLLKAETSPQLIDARSPEEFALNHIPNAVNFNLQSEGYESLVKGLSTTKPVFIYSIANGRSVALATDLRKRGFTQVHVLDGGIGAWTGNGNPLITTAQKGLTLAEYNTIVASNKRVLVDIGSKFCGSCKKVKPILQELRKQHGDSLKIVEIELEESPQLIGALKTVTAFPYLILYEQGQVVLKRAGLTDLKQVLDQHL